MKESHLSLWEAVQRNLSEISMIIVICIVLLILAGLLCFTIARNMSKASGAFMILIIVSMVIIETIVMFVRINGQIFDDTQKTYVSGKDTVTVKDVTKGNRIGQIWSFESNGHTYHVKSDPHTKNHDTPSINKGDKVKIDMDGTFLHENRTIYDTELDYRIVK